MARHLRIIKIKIFDFFRMNSQWCDDMKELVRGEIPKLLIHLFDRHFGHVVKRRIRMLEGAVPEDRLIGKVKDKGVFVDRKLATQKFLLRHKYFADAGGDF